MAFHDEFLFVNVNRPDEVKNKGTQRAIRRRVMRDIGRSRRKPRDTPTVTFVGQQHPTHNSQSSIRPALESSPLPIVLNQRARELVHFMQSEAEYRYRPFRDIWFKMALFDASAFKLSMANAAMFLDEVNHPTTFQYERCREALVYYGQSVREVTSRLADPVDRASEGLMTTVLGLICHDVRILYDLPNFQPANFPQLYVGTMDRWAYHIQGLKRMIEIRHGFFGIDNNLQLFASWFDVMGSVVGDTPPRLVEHSSFSNIPPNPVSRNLSLYGIIEDIKLIFNAPSGLALALERIAAVCNFVDAHSHQPAFWRQEEDLSPLTMLGPPTYLLLSLPRFVSSSASCPQYVHEMARLALLIFLAGLKITYGLAAPEMDLLQDKICRLIQGDNMHLENHCFFPRLQNWAIVIAILCQTSGAQKTTYTKAIAHRMSTNGYKNGAAVLEDARSILWVDCLASSLSIKYLIAEIDQASQT